MSKLSKFLFGLFILIIILTTAAFLLKSHVMMGVTGLCLFGLVMIPYYSLKYSKKKIESATSEILPTGKTVSDYLSMFIRKLPVLAQSVFQSVGFWIVGYYSDLNTFDPRKINPLEKESLMFMLFMVFLGTLGQLYQKPKGKNIYKWISNVVGNFTFLRSLLLLIIAATFPKIWQMMLDFFSNPFWFLDYHISWEVRRFFDIGNTLILLFVALVLINACRYAIKDKTTSADKKEFAWGLVFFLLYFLTIPGVYIVNLIYYLWK